MTYRFRKQAITGKLVLQVDVGVWEDADKSAIDPATWLGGEFELVRPDQYRTLIARSFRAEKADRRAAGQRNSIARRKTAETQSVQDPRITGNASGPALAGNGEPT